MQHLRTDIPDMPLVTVIIPCYNSALFLPETLQSVLAQNYENLQLVLVDDGSTDNTREIILALAATQPDRIVALIHDNGGAATARNRGLVHARGDYIQFLDADDLLPVDAISRRVTALQQSGADVAYSDWQKLEETDPGVFVAGEVIARAMEDVDADPAIALFTSFWCPPAALLYSRSIVERIGGWKQHLAPIEDARFMLDAVLCGGRYQYVPGVGAMYRIHHGPSHSRQSPLKFVRAVLANAIEVEQHWRQGGDCSSQQQNALLKAYDYTARMLLSQDAAAFELALAGMYRARPGLQWNLPKVAGLVSRLIGLSLTAKLLGLAGKLPK